MALKNKKTVLPLLLCICIFGSRVSSDEDHSDIEAQLKILNKQPVLSFEEHGDVIDCVDLYKQPAFENPLLRNHSIQINPSFEINPEPESESKRMYGSEKCPDGTVPIRRTTKDDLLRLKSLPNFHLDISDPSDDANPNYHVAVIRLNKNNILGARAHVGVHSPSCYGEQMTAMFVGINNGPTGSQDNILGGWMKYPQMHGDDRTHLTIFWSNRARGQGCFNLHCPGFVQIDSKVRPGNSFNAFSVFQGDTFEVRIEIHQDPQTKNWWFIEGGARIGYWPKELFSGLEGGGGSIFFGGVAIADGKNVSPQMGFGAFPGQFGHGELIRESGFGRFIEYSDASGDANIPEDSYKVENSRKCYRLANTGITTDNGYLITYGGPGGGDCTNS